MAKVVLGKPSSASAVVFLGPGAFFRALRMKPVLLRGPLDEGRKDKLGVRGTGRGAVQWATRQFLMGRTVSEETASFF